MTVPEFQFKLTIAIASYVKEHGCEPERITVTHATFRAVANADLIIRKDYRPYYNGLLFQHPSIKGVGISLQQLDYTKESTY